MSLTGEQKVKLIQKIISRINRELEIAIENDLVEEFLEKYGIELEENSFPIFPKHHKVLVLGALVGKIEDYKLAAKKIGINPNQLDFVYDYGDLKRFNVAKLEYSNEYSDIIYGPNPHSQTGMGDTSSFLATLKKEPDKYPKVIEAIANSSLKITISNFKTSLMKTRLFDALY